MHNAGTIDTKLVNVRTEEPDGGIPPVSIIFAIRSTIELANADAARDSDLRLLAHSGYGNSGLRGCSRHLAEIFRQIAAA